MTTICTKQGAIYPEKDDSNNKDDKPWGTPSPSMFKKTIIHFEIPKNIVFLTELWKDYDEVFHLYSEDVDVDQCLPESTISTLKFLLDELDDFLESDDDDGDEEEEEGDDSIEEGSI